MSDYWSQDIVERLRQRAEAAKEEATGTAVSDATHFTQAADEIVRLRDKISEASDLLAERAYGSPARSAAHNARLVLDAAFTKETKP